MKVEQGWSGEIRPNEWVKFKVTCDETDLTRILATESTVDSASALDDLMRRLPVHLAYGLLEIEAEKYVVHKLVTRYDFAVDAGREKLSDLETARAALLSKINLHVPA